ncbi:WD40-repeat-containing domain protein [Suillus subluteus]|nr:WD40-repeat-containing domain protein [Suillus subluteus]
MLEARKAIIALQVLGIDLVPYSTKEGLHIDKTCANVHLGMECREFHGDNFSMIYNPLTSCLADHIPSSTMIPQRRFSTLLAQSREYQRHRCRYHSSPVDPSSSLLFSDHTCDKESFPRKTTTILEVHSDELEAEPSTRDRIAEFVLRDHPSPVICLAWSLDDSILSTSTDHLILLWNIKTGALMKTLENHAETVSTLVWLPDGSRFMSGGLDRKIILWDMEGELRESWNDIVIRVTDAAVAPDVRRLVCCWDGIQSSPSVGSCQRPRRIITQSNGNDNAVVPCSPESRMIIYDLKTGQVELSVHMKGELTSVKISEDSREIHLWDLEEFRLARKFTGLRQDRYVIRSCFGGIMVTSSLVGVKIAMSMFGIATRVHF